MGSTVVFDGSSMNTMGYYLGTGDGSLLHTSSFILTPSSAIRRFLEISSTFTMLWFVIRQRSHNRVILIADDTPDGSDSCKLSVALKHSRGAHVPAGIATFYSADKI